MRAGQVVHDGWDVESFVPLCTTSDAVSCSVTLCVDQWRCVMCNDVVSCVQGKWYMMVEMLSQSYCSVLPVTPCHVQWRCVLINDTVSCVVTLCHACRASGTWWLRCWVSRTAAYFQWRRGSTSYLTTSQTVASRLRCCCLSPMLSSRCLYTVIDLEWPWSLF